MTSGINTIRENMLPYGTQWIDDDDLAEVIAVLESNYLTQGPRIAQFEQAVADYVGTKYAVAFANGTAALHGACFAAGIDHGHEVITTPITFAASSNCVLYQGGIPVFADISSSTYNIDPDDVERKITKKTKAIIPVDFTGQPAEIDLLLKIAEAHNLIVIQDAAHSLGAEYDGRKIGSFADMTMFSFHPVKHITTGEGGMIVTDNEHYYNQLQLFRSHGITKERSFIERDEGPWYYEMQTLGYNYRITDLQAALGTSQLRKLDSFVKRRREIVQLYNEAFQELEGIILPQQNEKANSSWHLYVLRFDSTRFKVSRREIFTALKELNIGVNVHYIPVYHHPYYQSLGYKKGLCEHAEQYYKEAITIPLFPKMTNQDVNDVIRAVRHVYEQII